MLPRIKFFLLILTALLLCGAALFWLYVGDRSTLTISGDLPDRISGLLLGDQQCVHIPCSLTVRPGEYTTTFEKTGYYSVTKPIRLYLLEETNINLKFQLRPYIRRIGRVNDAIPLNPLWNSVALPWHTGTGSTLNTLGIGSVQFLSVSPNTEFALGQVSPKSYFLQKKIAPIRIASSPVIEPVWTKENKLYFFQKANNANIWRLLFFDPTEQTTRSVRTFYNLTAPIIIPGSKYIVVVDKTSIDLINLSDQSRQDISTGIVFTQGKWNTSGMKLLLQSREGTTSLYDTMDQTWLSLDNAMPNSIRLLDFYSDNRLVTIRQEDNTPIQLVLYDVEIGKTQVLLSLPKDEPLPKKLEVWQGRIYFQVGENIYTIEGEIF